MKKLLVIAGLLVTASAVFAQGSLVFANLASGVNAPITNAAGARISGATQGTYVADLFYSTDLAAPVDSLQAANYRVTFATSGGGGYFLGGTRTLAGVAGVPIRAQVRVWNTQGGALLNYMDAIERGASNPFQFSLTLPPATPAPMVGLTGFRLILVPEPSSFALAGLGAAALLIFRRRK